MSMSIQCTCKLVQCETDAQSVGTAGARRLQLRALHPDGRDPPPRGQARRATLALAPGGRESRIYTTTNKRWEGSGQVESTGGAQDAYR